LEQKQPAGREELLASSSNSSVKEQTMLGTILIVFLILALVGAFPKWSHSRDWGYFPTGGVGLILAIVLVLVLLGRI
jgi:FtsH-binding integral membrane protein